MKFKIDENLPTELLRQDFMLMTAIRLLSVGLLAALGIWAADISGKWTSEIPVRDGSTATVTMNFKADHDKLTGTISDPNGNAEISDGAIEAAEYRSPFRANITAPNSISITKATSKVILSTSSLHSGTPTLVLSANLMPARRRQLNLSLNQQLIPG